MANPLENNYFNLIRTIKICYPNIENLLIYSYIDKESNMDNEDTAYKSILSDIINQTNKIIGNQFSFRLLILKKEIHKITGFEHDRHIFMNYNHIKLGGSINFIFDKNDKINSKNKSTIKIHSYFNPDNYYESLVVLELLKDIREQSNLNKRIPQHLKDITSNLFNFEENIMSNFTINPKYITKTDDRIIEVIKEKLGYKKSIKGTGQGKEYKIKNITSTSIKYSGEDRSGGGIEEISIKSIKESINKLKSLQSFNTNSVKGIIPNDIYRKRTPLFAMLFAAEIIIKK
jgi:hypothetical protein